jgi:uncharacterized protein YycO
MKMDVLISKLANLRMMAADRGVPKVDLDTIDDAITVLSGPRQFSRANLIEAVKTERYACSITVWMTLQDALAPDADDKGLDGWMREAEERVKRRLEGRQ